MQSPQPEDAVLEAFLRVHRQLDILGLDKPPIGNVVFHPMVVLGTGLLHTGPTVGLARVRRLQGSGRVEPSDEEEVLAEDDGADGPEPGDVSLGQSFLLGRQEMPRSAEPLPQVILIERKVLGQRGRMASLTMIAFLGFTHQSHTQVRDPWHDEPGIHPQTSSS